VSLRKRGGKRAGLAPEHRRPANPRSQSRDSAQLQRARAGGKRAIMQRLKGNWHRAVVRGGCVMCRAFPLDDETRFQYEADVDRLEGHHLLPKRHLPEDVKWDETQVGLELGSNGMCLCRYHHERHEHYAQRVPRVLLPTSVYDFAAKLNLGWLLDHEYPEEG
jgi:hypothetical protein